MPEVWVNSGFGANTKKPFVAIHEGDWVRQFTPSEARDIAKNLIECAEAAEQDAFMVHWAMEELDQTFEKAAILLHEYRKFREAQRGHF